MGLLTEIKIGPQRVDVWLIQVILEIRIKLNYLEKKKTLRFSG